MSFLSGLFGRSNPPISPETLNFEIQKGWFIADADLKKLSDYLSNHPSLRLTQSHDYMDDYNVLTLSVVASQLDCPDIDVLPTLIFRARKRGLIIILEPFIQFKEKLFSSRGKNPAVRLRFDDDEPIVYEENDTSYSTNKSGLFFERLDPFQKALVSNQMRVQIIPERGNTVLVTFDCAPARPVFKIFAEAICGPEYQSIVTTSPQIINHVLRMGPMNTLIYKKALAALRFNPGPLDYTKGHAFFKAIQSFAEAHHASEIYGVFEGNLTKSRNPNMPWTYILSKEVPGHIRKEIGSLKIFD